MLILFKVNMERRSSPMSGQRASQTQLLNTAIRLDTAQREPLSDVSELQRHGQIIGLVHISVGVRQNASGLGSPAAAGGAGEAQTG
jgi:hypothetical protein